MPSLCHHELVNCKPYCTSNETALIKGEFTRQSVSKVGASTQLRMQTIWWTYLFKWVPDNVESCYGTLSDRNALPQCQGCGENMGSFTVYTDPYIHIGMPLKAYMGYWDKSGTIFPFLFLFVLFCCFSCSNHYFWNNCKFETEKLNLTPSNLK